MTTAIVIGRNEGARLVACLASLREQGAEIVYVDSGSWDTSVSEARKAGALVVELERDKPFTAARARQAGFDALARTGDLPEFVMFVDGDCKVVDGWIDAGEAALRDNPDLGLVTGWRAELYPERSVYNAMCEFEWRRPAGEIAACGGDMMVRSDAFLQAGGFDPTVIAAEDDEFCVRLSKAGWSLRRIPVEMTRHDAAMLRFSQWWQRAVRTGHGFAQVGWMHPPYFRREQLRAVIYGLLLPLLLLIGLSGSAVLFLVVVALFGMNYIRTTKGLISDGLPGWEARRHARLLTLSKLPNMIGMIMFHWRRLRGRAMHIIEYK
ncbi:GT2 family glycosyltransferase [Shimia isoporae]|uniref:GT2 family glycosyltransferase n=1 Tax=Shimia isoporae TaxID=647720 RepID=A0A4R1N336_9RHOB|nr:glycosyltransferase family A protein [Shimia isoporae]TCL00739.1 GT2 family glycosyltransferase [Shimia isoporae]